jgi:NADP-dependent alcohol dehydrogenase
MGHEITAAYGLDHAQTLAVIFPATMTVMRSSKRVKLLQYAARLWNLVEDTPESRMDAAVARTRAFFESLGVKTRLADYGVPPEAGPAIARRFAERGWTALGEAGNAGPREVEKILAACL